MKPWKREAVSLLIGLLVLLPAISVAMAVIALTHDLPPDGPVCQANLSGYGGGSSGGAGVEAIDWSFFPQRVCEVGDGPPASTMSLEWFLLAAVIGFLAAGASASVVDRRLRRRDLDEVAAPDV